MARDFSELIKLFENAESALDTVLPSVATSVTLAAKALAQRSIMEKGFGESYSSNEIPIFFMKGKTKSKRGETFLDGLITKGESMASYKDLRTAEGLQTGHVDLAFSGEMWRNLFPKDVEVSGNVFTAPLGANTRAGQAKLNWNYERYGNFFMDVLKGDNIDKLYKVANDELLRFLEQELNK